MKIKFHKTLNAKTKHTISATVELPNPAHDYFSVTFEECERKHVIACGSYKETILRYFPELSDVVALHLADKDGIPMYAIDNGYYFLAGACGGLDEKYHGGNGHEADRSPEACLKSFRDLWRLHELEALEIKDLVLQQAALTGNGKDELWAQATRLAPRWKAEAEAAIAKYRALHARQATQTA